MLHQQASRLGQFCGRHAAQELRRVNQVDRRLGAFQHQSFQWDVERLSNLPQQEDRDIALPGFELRKISFRDLRIASQQLARHATSGAGLANPFAKQLEVIGFRSRFAAFGCVGQVGRNDGAMILFEMHYVALFGHGGCIILP